MNAHLRTHHGVEQFLVRGLVKVTCVAAAGGHRVEPIAARHHTAELTAADADV
jgi:hypothetical protein